MGAFDLLTASDSEDSQRRIAGALSVLGIRRGDRIALSLTNSPVVINTALAALRVGVVPVMLDHVNAGRLTLARFVDLSSAGPASSSLVGMT